MIPLFFSSLDGWMSASWPSGDDERLIEVTKQRQLDLPLLRRVPCDDRDHVHLQPGWMTDERLKEKPKLCGGPVLSNDLVEAGTRAELQGAISNYPHGDEVGRSPERAEQDHRP
jgi:hypothetical protein